MSVVVCGCVCAITEDVTVGQVIRALFDPVLVMCNQIAAITTGIALGLVCDR